MSTTPSGTTHILERRLGPYDAAAIIIAQPFEPGHTPRLLAERTQARVVVLAPSVGSARGVDDYPALFEHNVRLLAGAFEQQR